MANVVMPQQKSKGEGFGKLLTVGGAVAGGAMGGPGGAMMGASAGQTAGGLATKQPSATPGVQSGANGAMQRRMQSLQASQQNISALRDADVALAALPPDQAQQYAPAIKKARAYAEQEYA